MTVTDIERLAKVAGVLKWRMYRPGTYCVGTKPTFMVVGGTLTDSGWKACVEWLMASGDWMIGDDGIYNGEDIVKSISLSQEPEPRFPFATPGKPTADELGRAVLEVASIADQEIAEPER